VATNVTSDDIGDYLISSRSFAEYSDFFALRASDLRGSILDCPGGASEFTARACAAGAQAVAVDPAYALERDELARRAISELDRADAQAVAGHDRYRWEQFGSLSERRRQREQSARAFVTDLTDHPARYRPGTLPHLPFDAASFDLVLSSHLLFTYAKRLGLAFHLDALSELHRVARREVRIFPLIDQGAHPQPALLGDLRQALMVRRIETEVRRVPYEFQRGGNEMLVVAGRG
jgi:hypothetical protein